MIPSRAIAFQPTLLLLCVGACARPGRLEPSCDTPEGNLQVVLGRGTVPELTWSPICPIGWAHVARLDNDDIVWEITSRDSTNHISPSLVYGVVPAGTVQLHGPAPLQNGMEYQVSLGRFFQATNGTILVVLGQTTFRW
jgi:hypothetical protein